jgi:ribosomal protein S18 acetylase RimI-like enzyme
VIERIRARAITLPFMAGEVTIRDAREEDLDAVSALLAEAYAQYMPVSAGAMTAEERAGWEGYRQNIADVWSRAPISSTIVAERERKLLGSVNYYAPGQADSVDAPWPDGWASIRLLGVPPEARGLGIGRALMDECLRRARADKATTMGLHTTTLMDVARAMYMRLGFTRVPEYDFHPTPDFTVEAYAKRL